MTGESSNFAFPTTNQHKSTF